MRNKTTLEFEEGILYLNVVIKGKLYGANIELPELKNKNQEFHFAEQIANLVKNTMIQTGFNKGLSIIQ